MKWEEGQDIYYHRPSQETNKFLFLKHNIVLVLNFWGILRFLSRSGTTCYRYQVWLVASASVFLDGYFKNVES